MDIKVLRGKNQIGGNIVEVSNVNTRIILDAGYELNENDVQTIPPINGLFDSADYDAVFISHYHLDHMGLAESIHPETPVYMGDKALDIVRASLRYKKGQLSSDRTYSLRGEFHGYFATDIQNIHP